MHDLHAFGLINPGFAQGLSFGERFAAAQTLESLDNAVFIGEPAKLSGFLTGTTMTLQTCLSRQGKLTCRRICQDVRLTQYPCASCALRGVLSTSQGLVYFDFCFRAPGLFHLAITAARACADVRAFAFPVPALPPSLPNA